MLGSSRAFSFQSYLNPSLLRRQPLIGAHRPLSSFESGVPAASTFCESLADADDAALKRLAVIFTAIIRLYGDILLRVSLFVSKGTSRILPLKLH